MCDSDSHFRRKKTFQNKAAEICCTRLSIVGSGKALSEINVFIRTRQVICEPMHQDIRINLHHPKTAALLIVRYIQALRTKAKKRLRLSGDGAAGKVVCDESFER